MGEILIDFIDRVIEKAMKRSRSRGMYNKIIKNDILYLIKDDPIYMYRLSYIIMKKAEV